MSGAERGGRLLSLVIGVALTLGAAEAGLRLASWFVRPAEPPDDGVFTVLCEGDSFTYGVGGQAFPDQLDALLDAHAGDAGTWRVVNKGIPGYTSRHILDRLPQDLEAYQPDVLIVTTGENNRWNSVRLDGLGAHGPLARVDAALMRSRVYKFAKVAWIGWRHGTFHEWAEQGAQGVGDVRERVALPSPGDEARLPPLPEGAQVLYAEGTRAQLDGDYAGAVDVFAHMVAGWPDEPYGYFAQGGALLRAGRRPEAIEVLRRGAARVTDASEPGAARDVVMLLGHALKEDGDLAGASDVWLDGLRRWPADAELFVLIADALQADGGDPWAALAATGDVPGIADNAARADLMRLQAAAPATDGDAMAALVDDGLRRDAAAIAALARARGVRVVFTSYPIFAYPPVVDAAAEASAPYVDFRPVFAALFRDKSEFLSSDGCHANTEGYRVMAGALAPLVRALVGQPVDGDPASPDAVLAAGRAALEAFRAAGGGPGEQELEPLPTAENLAEEANVRRACGAVKARLEAIGGEDLSTAVGHRLRLRYTPAEMITLCGQLDGVDDDAMMTDLRARLDLSRAGL